MLRICRSSLSMGEVLLVYLCYKILTETDLPWGLLNACALLLTGVSVVVLLEEFVLFVP